VKHKEKTHCSDGPQRPVGHGRACFPRKGHDDPGIWQVEKDDGLG
jgi:hypothetical protein